MPHADGSPKTDAEFQAWSDANTLAEANAIKGDSKRLKAAQVSAAAIAKKEGERVRGLIIISKG